MRRKNKGGSKGKTDRKVEMVECRQCGCPNMPHAPRCMYCRAEIEHRSATVTEVVSFYLGSARDYIYSIGPKAGSVKFRFAGKAALFTLLTAILSVVGFRFLLSGVQDGGLFNWAVGILCLAYAGAVISNIIGAIRKL